MPLTALIVTLPLVAFAPMLSTRLQLRSSTRTCSVAAFGGIGLLAAVTRPGADKLAVLPSIVAVGAGAFYAWGHQYDGRVLPGVHVGSTDLGGLTRDQALA